MSFFFPPGIVPRTRTADPPGKEASGRGATPDPRRRRRRLNTRRAGLVMLAHSRPSGLETAKSEGVAFVHLLFIDLERQIFAIHELTLLFLFF